MDASAAGTAYDPAHAGMTGAKNLAKHTILQNPKAVSLILAVMVIVILALIWVLVACKNKGKSKDKYSPSYGVTSIGGANHLGNNHGVHFAGSEAAGGHLAHSRPEGPLRQSRALDNTTYVERFMPDADQDQGPSIGSPCSGPPSQAAVDELTALQHLEAVSPDQLGSN